MPAMSVDLAQRPCDEGPPIERGLYPNFEPPARGDLMEKSLPLSLWLGVALYAAIGLFGVIIFHDAAAITPDATAGYGISISNVSAASETGK